MRKKDLLVIAALLLAACNINQEQELPSPTEAANDTVPSASRIDIYRRFPSEYVPARTLRVYVPAGYDTAQRYHTDDGVEPQLPPLYAAVAAQIFPPHHRAGAAIHHQMRPFIDERHTVERCLVYLDKQREKENQSQTQ